MEAQESLVISCFFIFFVVIFLYLQWKRNHQRRLERNTESDERTPSFDSEISPKRRNDDGNMEESTKYPAPNSAVGKQQSALRHRLPRSEELRRNRAQYFEKKYEKQDEDSSLEKKTSAETVQAVNKSEEPKVQETERHHDPETSHQKHSGSYTKFLRYGENSSDAAFTSSIYDASTQQPICQPIKTLEGVLSWRPGFDEFNVASVEYTPPATAQERRQKTLVCHDMKGGYIEDRFCQGVESNKCYTMYHWQYVDIFVYFSHYFVTIPPPCWTNAAHTHAVPVLGTVITEWDDGAKRCAEFLTSEETYKKLANQLVDIAVYYGFDGWLINIENPIQPLQINRLADFVKYLTDQMHKRMSHSLVIWYDSVTYKGDLKWQNELNSQNRLFFDSCDGIFLNYTWSEANLIHSAGAAAVSTDRITDVYVGVDVFGRGCFGGGGFNCNKACSVIRQHKLSVALFAPGWVMESHGEEKFIENQNKFWNLLSPHCFSHGVTSLPFWTSFCQGFGSSVHVQGKAMLDKPWSNMSCQQIQPSFINSYYNIGHHVRIQDIKHMTDMGYHGGGCLAVQGTVQQAQVPSKAVVRLFKVDLATKGPFLVTLTYQLDPADSVEVALQLLIDRKPTYLVLGSTQAAENEADAEMKPSDEEKLLVHGILPSKSIFNSTLVDNATLGKDHFETFVPITGAHQSKLQDLCGIDGCSSGQWMTRCYLVAEEHLDECHIKEIRLVCANKKIPEHTSESQQFKLHLGEIKIIPGHHLSQPIPEVHNCRYRDVLWNTTSTCQDISLTLLWECTVPHSVCYCDIYRKQDDKLAFLGRSFVPSFRVAQIPVSKDLEGLTFVIQAVSKAGFTHSLDKSAHFHIQWK